MVTITEHAETYRLEFMDKSTTFSVVVRTEIIHEARTSYINIYTDYGADWYYKCQNPDAFAVGLGRALEYIQSYQYTCKNEVIGEIERTVKLVSFLFGGMQHEDCN